LALFFVILQTTNQPKLNSMLKLHLEDLLKSNVWDSSAAIGVALAFSCNL